MIDKVHIGTTIEKQTHRRLKVLCLVKELKISELIRNTIEDFIKQNQEVLRQ